MTGEPVGSPESARERVAPVVFKLQEIKHMDVVGLLDKEQADQLAGIAHVELKNLGSLKTADGEYNFHAARVFSSSPDQPSYVKPHYHTIGEEPYVILKSNGGEMNTGRVVDEKVVWDKPRTVSAGETIIVEEGQVHSLRNIDEESLDFVFACPQSHLTDPPAEGADRFFTASLPNGTPPQYPQTT